MRIPGPLHATRSTRHENPEAAKNPEETAGGCKHPLDNLAAHGAAFSAPKKFAAKVFFGSCNEFKHGMGRETLEAPPAGLPRDASAWGGVSRPALVARGEGGLNVKGDEHAAKLGLIATIEGAVRS